MSRLERFLAMEDNDPIKYDEGDEKKTKEDRDLKKVEKDMWTIFKDIITLNLATEDYDDPFLENSFISPEYSLESIRAIDNEDMYTVTTLLVDTTRSMEKMVRLNELSLSNETLSKEEFFSIINHNNALINKYGLSCRKYSPESINELGYLTISTESIVEVIKDMFKALFRAIGYMFDAGAEFFKRWFYLLESLEANFKKMKDKISNVEIKHSGEEVKTPVPMKIIIGTSETINGTYMKSVLDRHVNATEGVNEISAKLSGEVLDDYINKWFVLGNKVKKGKLEVIKSLVSESPPLGTETEPLARGIYYEYEVDSYEKNPLLLTRHKADNFATGEVGMIYATKDELVDLVEKGLLFCQKNISMDRSLDKYKKQFSGNIKKLEKEFKRDKKLETIRELNKYIMKIIKRLRDLLVDVIESNGQYLKALNLYIKLSVKKQRAK